MFSATWLAATGHRMAIDKVAGRVSFSTCPPPSDEQSLAPAKIKAVTAGSPAALNGLKEGERIYEIDDKPVSVSMDSEEVAAMLRGAPGTVVRLQVGPPTIPRKGCHPSVSLSGISRRLSVLLGIRRARIVFAAGRAREMSSRVFTAGRAREMS